MRTRASTPVFFLSALVAGVFFSSCMTIAPKKNTGEMDSANVAAKKATGSGNGGRSPIESEISDGLKQALGQGAEIASREASKPNGFLGNEKIRIPFPPEITQVEKALANMGLSKLTDQFVVSLNRAAEKATVSARPILIAAITKMSISDAVGILKGPKTAATDYLRRTSSEELRERFGPAVTKALDDAKVTQAWIPVAAAYNSLPIVTKVNPDLKDYVTSRAIDGLFSLIAEEESKIRENPARRTTDLLKRVFASATI